MRDDARLAPPLDLSPTEFRELADRVSAAATSYLASLDDRPAFPDTTGAATNDALGGPLPELGIGAAAFDVLEQLAAHARIGNGRFFAYVHGSGEPVAALGDLYASVLNQNVTSWRSAPGATTIERTVVGWLAEAIGCPGFVGVPTSGGSLANLMALAMAREAKSPANEHGAQPCVVYGSTEIHMSIPKAMSLLGVGHANLRAIPVDERFRIDLDALKAAIEDDRSAGRRAIAIVASAGTIVTGAIDPLAELARIAREHDLWLHVDGAYGVTAAIAVPERFEGLALADSVTLDAHKWLYQPLDCSVLLYRDADVARQTFAYTDDYARVLLDAPVESFAFFEESIELSRRFRTLKLWLSLRYHGLEQFRAAIRKDLEHAQLLRRLVEETDELELLAPVELSAVCFRHRAANAEASDRLNAEILRRVVRRGRVVLSNATVRGSFALRACVVNHRTTADDVRAVVDEVVAVGRDVSRG